MMLFIYISVCLEAHAVPHRGVPPGITACLARECLQASAGVNGLTHLSFTFFYTCEGELTLARFLRYMS